MSMIEPFQRGFKVLLCNMKRVNGPDIGLHVPEHRVWGIPHAKPHLPFLLGFERKAPFVDESTITVNYDDRIGRGSYGTVYRGSYQGTPAAVKMIEIGDNPVTTNELIIPW